MSIDDQLIALPAGNTAARDRLWVRLAEIADQMPAEIARLAAAPASHLAAIRAKAAVLALVLHGPNTGGAAPRGNASSPGSVAQDAALIPEVVALALSVAHEVVNLP